jgi:hypothetical protein
VGLRSSSSGGSSAGFSGGNSNTTGFTPNVNSGSHSRFYVRVFLTVLSYVYP